MDKNIGTLTENKQIHKDVNYLTINYTNIEFIYTVTEVYHNISIFMFTFNKN